MGIVSPFTTSPSPLYYGSGFLPAADYRRLGANNLVALLAIGMRWLFAIK